MLPFLNKDRNKMITTLLDNRSGKKAEVSPDSQVKSEDYNHDLERACGDFLTAIERKSIPELMEASKAIHQACDKETHEEGPHSNEEESEE